MCHGFENWIHRRYMKNKPNCSGLESNEVYECGVYICPNCTDPKKKSKGPGRPVERKNTMKVGSQKRYGRLVSRISLPAKGKRKAREVGTPEKNKSIGKKDGEKIPEKNKLKTDGNKEEENEGISDKDKNGNKKS